MWGVQSAGSPARAAPAGGTWSWLSGAAEEGCFDCSASTLHHKPLKQLSCSISAWSGELKGGVESGGWA